MTKEYVKGCPECKLFSMYVYDDCFIYWGWILKKYKCDECGSEEVVE